MAQVPVAQGNRVQLRPVSGARYEAVQDDSVQNLGRAMVQLGDAGAQTAAINDQIETALDEAEVRRLDNEDSQWLRERLWTGDGAYFRQRGLDAVNARPAIEEEMRARQQARREDLGSARARAMYERVSQNRFGQEFEGIARYAGEQADLENDRQSQARIAQAANDAQLAGTDDVRRNTFLGVAEQEILSVIDRQGGSPERAREAIQQLRSSVLYNIALNIANTDPVEAYQFRVRHAGDMEADELLRLDTTLDSALDARQDMEEEEAIVQDRPSRNIRGIVEQLPEPVEPGTVDVAALLERSPQGTNLETFAVEGNAGAAVLLPSLGPDGQRMSQEEALRYFRLTGQHMGVFRSTDEAERYAAHLRGEGPTIGTVPAVEAALTTRATRSVSNVNLDTLHAALIQQESGGRRGVLGPRTRWGRAMGLGQVLDGTARQMARRLGIAYRRDLMTGTSDEAAAYQLRISKAYFEEALRETGGDVRQALMYYHGGPNRQLWGRRTRAYAAAVMQRAGARDGATGQAPVGAGPQASDLGELRRRLEARNLPPDQRERVWQRLQMRVAREQAIINQQQTNAADRAMEYVANLGNNFTDTNSIPRQIWTELSPQTRIQLQGIAESNQDRLVRGQAPRTDSRLFAGLSDAYASDPQAFLRMRPEDVRARLDDDDYNTYLGWRRDILQRTNGRPGDAPRGDQQTTVGDIMSVSRELLRGAGFDLGERAPAQDAQRVAEFQRAMLRWAEGFRRSHNRAPNPAEIREAADRNLIEVHVARDSIWGGSDRRFTFEIPGNRVRAGDPNNRVQVPDAIRRRIVQAYERRGRGAPDERTIQETYLRGVWENRW